jgi:ribosomal protein S18 acetylase RimI-like enzyme
MRKLVPDDAEDIAELDLELFPNNCFNARTLRNEIAAGGEYPGYCLRGFHGEVIGYALVRSQGGLRDLTRIGVVGSKQMQGHGQRLIERAMHDSEILHQSTMLCVRKKNAHAIRWYKRVGFHIVGDLGSSWTMVRHIDCGENVLPQTQR